MLFAFFLFRLVTQLFKATVSLGQANLFVLKKRKYLTCYFLQRLHVLFKVHEHLWKKLSQLSALKHYQSTAHKHQTNWHNTWKTMYSHLIQHSFIPNTRLSYLCNFPRLHVRSQKLDLVSYIDVVSTLFSTETFTAPIVSFTFDRAAGT